MHWGNTKVQDYPKIYNLWIEEVLNSTRFGWGLENGGLPSLMGVEYSDVIMTCSTSINLPTENLYFPFITTSLLLDFTLLVVLVGLLLAYVRKTNSDIDVDESSQQTSSLLQLIDHSSSKYESIN